MKKYFYLAITALLCVGFASCGKDKEPENNYKSALTFNITVSDITSTSATINVAPSNATEMYFWDLLAKADIDEYFEGNMDSVCQYMLDYYKEEYDSYIEEGYDMSSYDINSAADLMEYYGVLLSGEDEYTYKSLDPETEYVVFAFAYDATNNKVNSKPATKNFTTGKVEKISLSFSLEENDTAYFFIPSNTEATYLCTMVDADSLGSYTPATYYAAYVDYIAQVVSAYASLGISWDYFLNYGKVYIPKSDLEEGHAYKFLAAGNVAGTTNSDLCVVDFGAKKAAPARVAAAEANKINKVAFAVENRKVKMFAKRTLSIKK